MDEQITKWLASLLVILLFAAAVSLRPVAARDYQKAVTEDDRYYLPPSGWLKAFSLGYTEALADLVWVKTIIHFGDQMKKRSQGHADGFVMNYLLTASDLDPKFRTLYTTGSTLTMYQGGGKTSRKSLEMAIELLERGIKAFPDDGELYFNLGFIHHYEMLNFVPEDPDDPVTKEHLRLGRYYFAKAALMDNAPPYASMLSASLMQKWDASDMVVAHLKAMLAKESDPTVRAELISKLRAEAGKSAERDIAETERLHAAWQKKMPYVPFDFYLFLRTDAPIEEMFNPLYQTDRMLHIESIDSTDTEPHPVNEMPDGGLPDSGV